MSDFSKVIMYSLVIAASCVWIYGLLTLGEGLR